MTSPGERASFRAMWAEMSMRPEWWNDMSCFRDLCNILFIAVGINRISCKYSAGGRKDYFKFCEM